MTKRTPVPGNVKIVRTGILEMLKAERCAVARSVNGHRRTTHGETSRQIAKFEKLVEEPAVDLRQHSVCSSTHRKLWRVRAFDRAWPEQQICQTLSGQFLTGIVLKDIESNSSSVLRDAARAHSPCFLLLRLLSEKNREARSFSETEALDSG